MRKSIPIEKLYTPKFGECKQIEQTNVFASIKQLFNRPEIKPEDSSYYKILDMFIKAKGHAFGWIKTEEDKIKRVNQVKDLIKSLRENGYQKKLEGNFHEKGITYGPIVAERMGDYYGLIDGHHRSCIMILLGHKSLDCEIHQGLKFIKRKEVNLAELYADGFSCLAKKEPVQLFSTYRYVEFMRDFLDNPDKNIEDCKYYKDRLETYNSDLKRKYTLKEAKEKTQKVKDMVKDIQQGYKEEKKIEFNYHGYPRPAVSGILTKNGKIALINGFHRCSIMYALGHKTIPMMLFKVNFFHK